MGQGWFLFIHSLLLISFTYFFSHSLIILILLQTTHKLICSALRLPIPPGSAIFSGEVGSGLDAGHSCSTVTEKLNKLLLLGCDQSGTSTLFKQVQYGQNISLKKKMFLYVSLDSR